MKSSLIDIGVNLMHRSFRQNREQVIKQAEDVSVTRLIITGTNVRGSEEAARYAGQYKGRIFSTAGVHPHDAKGCGPDTIARLRKLSRLSQVAAIGECGLDYDRDFSPRPVQRKWFEEQIQLAREEQMPLFLHERKAFGDFSEILRHNSDVCKRAVVHCFTGTKKELDVYLELGCYIGITGWICDERRGRELRELVKYIPGDRLMAETDAPFLIPRNLPGQWKGRQNEPKYLPHIISEIALCRNEDEEQLRVKTTQNATRFFELDG